MIPLETIDAALASVSESPPKIRCLEAVTESYGYGDGVDHGFRRDVIPVLLNPNVSEGAAQVVLNSSVFRDSISAAALLMTCDSDEMTAKEWLKLLTLLMMRCSSSDLFQAVASKMESECAEMMSKRMKALKEKDSSSKLTTFKKALFSRPFQIDDKIDTGVVNEDVNALECSKKESVTKLSETNKEHLTSNKDESASPKQKLDFDDRCHSILEGDNSDVTTSSKKNDSSSILDSSPVVNDKNSIGTVATEVKGNSNVAVVEAVSEAELFKKARSSSLREKLKRQKAREDAIMSFVIKNQLKSTVASFVEDHVSQAIESALVSKQPGLSFGSTRCRGQICDLCGLSDTSLSSPLIRMPNNEEWDKLIHHAERFRRTHLVADLRDNCAEPFAPKIRTNRKIIKLIVRVGDELISDEPDNKLYTQIKEGGMIEFLPRNSDGFQDELLFRYNAGLPFISGSMTAHEVCACAQHSARKNRVIEEYKEKQAMSVEREAGMHCGRTLYIGTDNQGRSYWNFLNDPESLFICDYDSAGNATWQRISEAESISSIIVYLSLGKDVLVNVLRKIYSLSSAMIENKSWSEKLLKRHFKVKRLLDDDVESKVKDCEKEQEASQDNDRISDEEEPYEEGEQVLVESKCGTRLWDAKIIGVAKGNSDKPKDMSYRVSYKSWSSRFDEWVSGERVVEPSDNNIEVQKEMIEDEIYRRQCLPAELEDMVANSYFNSKDRARGCLPLPPFSQIMKTGFYCSDNDKTFCKMKAALLAIEAALPLGSVDHTKQWSPELASQWRLNCLHAKGPWDLMRCVIFLEDNIDEDWIEQDIGYIRQGLPLRMKALEEASPASIAIRVFLLDKSIKYNCVDKKRYKPKKKKS